jgi:hypothetical protein
MFCIASGYGIGMVWLAYWVGDGDGADRAARELSTRYINRTKEYFGSVYSVATNLAASAETDDQAWRLHDALYYMFVSMEDERRNTGDVFLWPSCIGMWTNDLKYLHSLRFKEAIERDRSKTTQPPTPPPASSPTNSTPTISAPPTPTPPTASSPPAPGHVA